MKDQEKTKEQLIKDLEKLRKQIKQHEEEFIERKKAEEKFKILFDSSRDAIMTLEPPTWKFTSGNSATVKMFGVENEKNFISRPPWKYSPKYQPDGQLSKDKAKEMIMKAMKIGTNFFEWIHKKFNGPEFPATVLLTKVIIGDKEFLQATVRDITDRIKAEKELAQYRDNLESLVKERTNALEEDIAVRKKVEKEKKELQTQLLQSQKMESIGVLAGGIAHDFNNILTAIISGAELLLKDATLKKMAKSDIEGILNSSLRGAKLTKQLLVFSRENLVTLKPLEINKIVIGSIEMLKKIIGESINIKLSTEKEDCYINGDEGNIEQVLMNMVINARDAMPAGGKILISIKKCKLAKKMGDIIPGEYVQLICEDNGVGMTKEIKERIFDPFFTTKGVGKGTGLGLSVVFGIVKEHNAYINVNSNPGKGTTFNIYFPAIKYEISEISKEEEISLAGNGEKLLVIEDDEDVRHVLKRILEDKNFKIVFAESIAESETLYLKDPCSIDLVLCDAVLPDGHGTDAIEKLNKIKPVKKVIFISGYLDNKSLQEKIRKDKYPFIHKPFIINDLLKIISETLE